jgi:hypothetical protein
VAAKTAAWYLERTRPLEYAQKRGIVLEGGANPLNVQQTINQTSVNYDVSVLDLPVEMKRALLDAIERRTVGESKGESNGGTRIPQLVDGTLVKTVLAGVVEDDEEGDAEDAEDETSGANEEEVLNGPD